ncbi:MAG: hypothetical protein JW885_09330 [Deltaproteobacteria bacterium]|nr:hypothetical protein [Candidatus Zymogenaceae bacterium]
MSPSRVVNLFLKRFVASSLEPFFRRIEATPGYSAHSAVLSPFDEAAAKRTRCMLDAAYREALEDLPDTVFPRPTSHRSGTGGFSARDILADTACRYDKGFHRRCRIAGAFISRHIFTHRDIKIPFSERTEREASRIDRIAGFDGPVLYLPNYHSHLDSLAIAVYLDVMGLSLPCSAIGNLLMPTPGVEDALKRLMCIKITKDLLWSAHREEYEEILARYAAAIMNQGASLVVHAEASRYTTRSIDGTLRATIPEWILTALMSCGRDVLVVPLSASYFRVPEDRSLVYRSPLMGILTPRDRGVAVPVREYLRFGRDYGDRLFQALLESVTGVFGRAYVVPGEPFLAGELQTPAGDRPAFERKIVRRVMEDIAVNKRIFPVHVAVGELLRGGPRTMKELASEVGRKQVRIDEFCQRYYHQSPSFDNAFQGDMARNLTMELEPLVKRKIVGKSPWPPRRYWVRDIRLGRFYANQADVRVYAAKARYNITMVNAGAFGYTLTAHLGRKFEEHPQFVDYGLILYDARERLMEAISETRSHPDFFEGSILPRVVHVETDLAAAVRDADVVIIATPSHHFRAAVRGVLREHEGALILLIATKGFEAETALLPVEMAWEETERLGRRNVRLAVLSGANLASEIMEGKLTVTQIAAEDIDVLDTLVGLFETPLFLVDTSNDVTGVQLAAAMKNVYAIAYGICDGAKDSSVNFTAALVTRISREVGRLGRAMGARDETFGSTGQAWMADFLATARGGRNSQFGRSLTKTGVAGALAQFRRAKKNVEGYQAVRAALVLSERYKVDLPIVRILADILFDGGMVDPLRFLEREPGSAQSYTGDDKT